MRTLSNPDVGASLSRVTDALASSGPEGRALPTRRVPQKARYGSIQKAVLQVLFLSRGPMSVQEIHRRTNAQLGGVAYSSVKNAVADLAKSPDRPVRRLSHGVYDTGRSCK
jgi:hypothetical protein